MKIKSIAQVLCMTNLDKLQEEYDRRQKDLQGHNGLEPTATCPICEQLRWECFVIARRTLAMRERKRRMLDRK